MTHSKKRNSKPASTAKLAQYIASNTRHSRRDLAALIQDGRITVNDEPVTQYNLEINPNKDKIKIADTPIKAGTRMVFLFHKPSGVISTLSDPQGRKNLGEVIRALPEGVKPVGRLDRNTSGLMVLTNDGNLAQELNHPTMHVEKTYKVTLDQRMRAHDVARLLAGFFLEDGPVQFLQCHCDTKDQLTVVIAEGRNRIVRRSFEHLGYLVKKLKRTAVGPYQLGNLGVGQIIKLT